MRMTEDQLTRDVLASTSSVYNCVGGNNGDLPTNMTLADLDEVTSTLLTNDAWQILDSQQGEDRFGTAPIRSAYLMLSHTKMTKTFNNLDGFIPKWNYPQNDRDSKILSD